MAPYPSGTTHASLVATVAAPGFGVDRTIPMVSSRGATQWVLMMVERFAVWHRVEPRIDVWASAGALALAGVATVALVAVGSF